VGYICLYEGVRLKLAIAGKNKFIYYLFPNIYAYISEYYFQKSLHACRLHMYTIIIRDKIFAKNPINFLNNFHMKLY